MTSQAVSTPDLGRTGSTTIPDVSASNEATITPTVNPNLQAMIPGL